MAMINLEDVYLDYPVFAKNGRSIKNLMERKIGGIVEVDKGFRVTIHSLNNVSLTINEGDRVAIFGGNGAGKSTLLKVLSGIYEPPSGTVTIQGRVSSLLDYNMGMDKDATGYENILLRSIFLGATFKQAKEMVPDIEEFSELGEYLNFPIRTYSTGMVVRLSFAVSTVVPPEILIMDEQVAAVDSGFAARAAARLHGFVDKAKILIFATHDMAMAQDLCSKGIVMHKGSVHFQGSVAEAVAEHQKLTEAA